MPLLTLHRYRFLDHCSLGSHIKEAGSVEAVHPRISVLKLFAFGVFLAKAAPLLPVYALTPLHIAVWHPRAGPFLL